mgnify:CR=1 FL=1|tara:strand:- start:441 stop:4394 length:3954 start_codon:yes stop_codon:yes gene_type:complete
MIRNDVHYNYNAEIPFNTGLKGADIVSSPSWFDTLGANLEYQYKPFINAIHNAWENYERDEEFNAIDHIKDTPYYEYRHTLADAKNRDHLNDLIAQVDGMNEARETLARSGIFNQFTTGIFDPLNLLALPFGGPAFGIGRSALRVGLGVTAIQAPVEAGRQLFDPSATYTESGINLGAAFVVGGAIGGAMAVPARLKANVQMKTQQELDEFNSVINTADAEQLSLLGKRDERILDVDGLTFRSDELTDKDVANLSTWKGVKEYIQKKVAPYSPIKFQKTDQFDRTTTDMDVLGSSARLEIKELGEGLHEFGPKNPEVGASYNVTANTIYISKDAIMKQFKAKAWTKPRTLRDGSKAKALPNNAFKSFEEYYDFVVLHEGMHSRKLADPLYKRKANESVGAYEDRINSYAMKEFQKHKGNSVTRQIHHSKLKKIAKWFESEKHVRSLEEADGTIKNPYSLAENWFTKSWMYKGVTNPMKRVLQGDYDQSTKLSFIRMMGDHGVLLEGHRNGVKGEHSVFTKASTYEGEWVEAYDEVLKIYGEVSGKGKPKESVMDYHFNKKPFELWLEETWLKSAKKQELTDLESKAVDTWDKFFKRWEVRLTETGHLGSDAGIARRVAKYTELNATYDNDLAKYKERLGYTGKEKNEQGYIISFEDWVEQNSARINTILKGKDRIEFNILIDNKRKISRQLKQHELQQRTREGENAFEKMFKPEKFFPRFFNKQRISENRIAFEKILSEWMRENPYTYAYDPKDKIIKATKISTDPDDISKRVKEMVDKILNEGDPFEGLSYGYGKSKHFKHKMIDIPNELIADFIITNPVQAMMAYTNRTASQFEFYKMFGHEDPEIVANEILLKEARRGLSENQLNALRRDFLHSYDRVAGVVIQNPDAWNLYIAQLLKDFAALNYLGSAGFSTLPDFAAIMMQNDLRPFFSQLIRTLDNEKVRMNAMEARIAGEMLEILKGDVYTRLMEDTLNNPFQSTFRSKAKNTFFQLNLLGPMTRTFKQISSMAHSHTIVDYSIKWANNKITNKQAQWMLRMGLDKKDALKIAKMREKGFIEKSGDDKSGFYLANTNAWDDPEAVTLFRRTLNSSVKNTVLMGTPADKPIVSDGVFYVPIRVGKHMGLLEDKRFKGYARIENGIIALPFQFYSYSFAALNKITTLYTQGAVNNRLVGMGSAMALAYMGMQLKYRNTPWVLDEMSLEDKIARSFDMSGLAAMYSDMFYTSMQTSMALGMPPIDIGISPKFPQKEDFGDAITSVTGASTGLAYDQAKAVAQFIQGDYGAASKDFISNLPYMRLWFLKSFVNDLTRTIAGTRY